MHKPSDNGHDEDDILGLIADIHGTAPPEQEAMERALGTLENGARHASAAMQRFERTGRTHRTEPPTRLPEKVTPSAAADASPEVTRLYVPGAPESAEVTQMYRPVPPQAPGPTDAAGAMPAEVTQFYAPGSPHRGAPPAATPDAVPTPPPGAEANRLAIPAEVLGGRGAEFIDIGHTRTHIRAPIKPTKK
jgi:hypothetical protein